MKITKDHKDKIIKMYNNGISSLKIAKDLGFSKCSILRTLEKAGIKRRPLSEAKRKYHLNESFFEKIDDENKAYFLGLLSADGYNDIKRGNITIALLHSDKTILEKFSNLIGWNRDLYILSENRKSSYKNIQKMVKIDLRSRKLSNDLSKLGCASPKSFSLKWPIKLKKKYYNHFIRGYFDGDGYVSKPETKLPKISIACSKEFAFKLRQIIMDKLKINVLIEKSNKTNKIVCLIINGRNQLLQFLDWVYKDATIFLDRKYIRYVGLKNKKLDNRGRKYYDTTSTINKELLKTYETI